MPFIKKINTSRKHLPAANRTRESFPAAYPLLPRAFDKSLRNFTVTVLILLGLLLKLVLL